VSVTAGPSVCEESGMSVRNLAGGLVVTLAVVVAACTTLQVGSDYDHNASFNNYHSFVLMERRHHGGYADTNPLAVQRAEDAIRSELLRKGYTPAADRATADFTVDFTIGSRERTDINTYPDPYVGRGWGWGGRGWWGGSYWGNDIDVRQYREGTLSVDIFDAHSHRPVWHGWAKKELTSKDIASSEAPIRHAVSAVLAKFPPSAS
jgi:uncharacterized protein DUF4136